jgi:hypothetical protein
VRVKLGGKSIEIPNRGARRRLRRLLLAHLLDGFAHVRSRAGRPVMTLHDRYEEAGDSHTIVSDYRYMRVEHWDDVGHDHCTTEVRGTCGYATRWFTW